MSADYMTGAELQTLREACGLTREELGTLARVQARSIKHWEQGRMGVPADVAAMVQGLYRFTGEQAQTMAKACPAVLLRYSTPEALRAYCPALAKMPLGLHGAIVGKVRALVHAQGKPCRVVWMQAEHYEPWRQASNLPDSEKTQNLWAAQQIAVQSQPFKADQPPKATA